MATRKQPEKIEANLSFQEMEAAIPPNPLLPPERSGGGQSGFSAKWVLTFSNKHHDSESWCLYDKVRTHFQQNPNDE
ncbi:hypothetical protein L0Y69_02510 [bacterium]|nr:hypothetical protein [bacterium]